MGIVNTPAKRKISRAENHGALSPVSSAIGRRNEANRPAIISMPEKLRKLLALRIEPRMLRGLRCWRNDSNGTLKRPALSPSSDNHRQAETLAAVQAPSGVVNCGEIVNKAMAPMAMPAAP